LFPPDPQPAAVRNMQIAIRNSLPRRTRLWVFMKKGMSNNAVKPKPSQCGLESRLSIADVDWLVVTVTIKLAEPPVERLIDAGLIEQVAYSGAPLQLSDTLPLNPLAPVRDRL
jgi:hypothetical protein